MKRVWLGLTLFALMLAACSEHQGVYSGKLILGGALTILPGETEAAHILLADGSLVIQQGGRVEGNVYQMLGSLRIEGEVSGDVHQYSGELALGPRARIGGDLRLGGGTLKGDPQAAVAGRVIESETPLPAGMGGSQPPLRERLGWMFAENLTLALLALLVGRYLPAPLGRVAQAACRYPLVAGAMGLLVLIVGLVLLVQMAFTILLIPVSMLGLALMGLAVAYGWIACGAVVGEWVAARLNRNWSPGVRAGVGTLIFLLVLSGLSFVPGPGDLPAILSVIVALGAVFLTRFGAMRFIPQTDETTG